LSVTRYWVLYCNGCVKFDSNDRLLCTMKNGSK